jgi:hypothetical protein
MACKVVKIQRDMTTEPIDPRRKMPSLKWWILTISLSIVAFFLHQLFGPNPKLIISKQTTYIAEPLRIDGWPDYEEYVLEQRRNGVTPENNAGTLLIPALWPANLDADQYQRVVAELGLKEIPQAKDALQHCSMTTSKNAFLPYCRVKTRAMGIPTPSPQ